MSTDHLYVTKASYDVMKSRAQARCAALEIELARERESRKQAEAALRDVVKQFPVTFAKYAALVPPAERVQEKTNGTE